MFDESQRLNGTDENKNVRISQVRCVAICQYPTSTFLVVCFSLLPLSSVSWLNSQGSRLQLPWSHMLWGSFFFFAAASTARVPSSFLLFTCEYFVLCVSEGGRAQTKDPSVQMRDRFTRQAIERLSARRPPGSPANVHRQIDRLQP